MNSDEFKDTGNISFRLKTVNLQIIKKISYGK